MENKEISFSPSVNIIRDISKNLNYVVTKNAVKIANQIVSDYNSQIHCFSIIGYYGKGKSSFLWALQKNLKNEYDFFFKANGQLSNLKKIEIVNIIGSYSPFEEVLHKALRLQVEPSISKVFEGFKRYYLQCLKANKFLVLLIDEFGKLLEYAAQNNPEERIFFIQQFAELVNNPDHKILLINTLHQNFNAYSSGLNSEQKQEWNKVR